MKRIYILTMAFLLGFCLTIQAEEEEGSIPAIPNIEFRNIEPGMDYAQIGPCVGPTIKHFPVTSPFTCPHDEEFNVGRTACTNFPAEVLLIDHFYCDDEDKPHNDAWVFIDQLMDGTPDRIFYTIYSTADPEGGSAVSSIEASPEDLKRLTPHFAAIISKMQEWIEPKDTV